MGFGSTAKKVQKLADVGEKTYKRLNEMREQMQELRGTVEDTGERVESLERELDEQRQVLDAIAREHDLDPDDLVTDVGEDDAASPDADPVDPSAAED